MYLSEHRGLRLFMMCALYFAQGVPWGFVTITLAAWIAGNGFSAEQIGPILGVATLPWSFKFLWGPVIDRYSGFATGRRRPWILLAQVTSIVTLTSLALLGDLDSMMGQATAHVSPLRQVLLSPLSLTVFLANVCISLQDVAVDALAVDMLTDDERGRANGLMYASSYLGTSVGGAGLGIVVGSWGIHAGLFGQAAILTGISVLPLMLRERRGDRWFPFSINGTTVIAPEMSHRPSAGLSTEPLSLVALAQLLIRAFTVRSSILGLVLAFAAKIGLGVLTAALVSHLIGSGLWSQEQYSVLNGGIAVFAGLTGTLAGGWAADRFGTRRILTIATAALSGLWLSFAVCPQLLRSIPATSVLLVMQELFIGAISVALFALFMTVSWPRVAATQFTAYMSCMNLSSTVGSFLAGELSHQLSLPALLLVAALIQFLSLVPLAFLDPGQTRRVLGS